MNIKHNSNFLPLCPWNHLIMIITFLVFVAFFLLLSQCIMVNLLILIKNVLNIFLLIHGKLFHCFYLPYSIMSYEYATFILFWLLCICSTHRSVDRHLGYFLKFHTTIITKYLSIYLFIYTRKQDICIVGYTHLKF